MSSCVKEPKATLYYLFRCNLYSIYRPELLNDICTLKESLKNSSEENLLKVLLYGAEDFTAQMNSEILKCTIKFIKQIALVALHFFPSIFFLPDQIFSIQYFLYVFYVFMFNLRTEFTVSGICPL